MKIRIDQKELADATKRAHRRLPTNPVTPIMAGLVLEADNDTVTLSGFDYETSTRAALEAEALEDGAVVASGRLLADVAGALPAGPVDLVADANNLTVTTPGNQFQMPLMPRHEYPSLPVPPEPSGTVNGALLADALVHAASAAMSQKDAVGQLEAFGGVHLVAGDEQLRMWASDRYRMVEHTIDWAGRDGSLLIPAAELAATAKTLADRDVTIAFPGPDLGVAALSGGGVTVTGRCIAAKFPDITRIFPKKEETEGNAVFDARDLADAVKRASLVNDDKTPIRLAIGDGEAVVHGGQHGTSGASTIAADIEGIGDFNIAFNPHYLNSLIAPIDGRVRLWLTTPTKPVLIEPVDGDTYRACLMPVRLSS
ncbi:MULTISPECIES: DNA polymerase III subunit beta [unclassified Streptomyces]|uniref:DNA polymerase III subunit beta n=1 Tax=unclassified Streptomyces TaxID=2593676 RepID=UPI002FC81B9D|nr:DNA polymerase III subunit beta [Streptomyces anthocyanicus]